MISHTAAIDSNDRIYKSQQQANTEAKNVSPMKITEFFMSNYTLCTLAIIYYVTSEPALWIVTRIKLNNEHSNMCCNKNVQLYFEFINYSLYKPNSC